jgi:hypothetical protein
VGATRKKKKRERECVASSSVSDIDRYVIVRNTVDCVSNMLSVFTCHWEIHTHLNSAFFRKVANTEYNVEEIDLGWFMCNELEAFERKHT